MRDKDFFARTLCLILNIKYYELHLHDLRSKLQKNIYRPFAIAKTKRQGEWRVRRYNLQINKSEETFFQLVRICIENGGYFNEGKIIKVEE